MNKDGMSEYKRKLVGTVLRLWAAMSGLRVLAAHSARRHRHSLGANADFARVSTRMIEELERDPIFLPSAFWRSINKINVSMLQADGIESFKRSVAQNYYNWLVIEAENPQLRQLQAERQARGAPEISPTRIERDGKLRVFSRLRRITLSERQLRSYSTFVIYLWESMLRRDSLGLGVTLSEPEIGNPIRVWYGDKLVSQDLANSILECNILAPFLKELKRPPRVAEIGAGYGRVAHVFGASQTGTYFIFDIPPALFVAQWYLGRVLPRKQRFEFRTFERFEDVRDEIERSDIAFLTANQLCKFPSGYFDAIISISTLPEMRPEQVSLYLELFQKLSSGYIYLKQWRDWVNPSDGTQMQTDDYRLGNDWTLVVDAVDEVNSTFFNRVWRRS